MDADTTSEIVFDEGEAILNKSPYELTKKQIWYKCFQRCFDEGSKQMSDSIDKNGFQISQPEYFMNSVTMFQIMAIGTLMHKRYADLFALISSVDDRITLLEQKHKADSRNIILESNKENNNRIDIQKTMGFLSNKFKNEMVLLFREKLGVLSILMEKEQYLDNKGGIKD